MKARGSFHRKWRGQRVTALMARDGTKCALCGEELDRRIRDPRHPRYVTFDHIRPRSTGGLDVVSNLQLAHRRCNELRGCDPVMPEDEPTQ